MVSLFSMGGLFTDDEVTIDNRFTSSLTGNLNSSVIGEDPPSAWSFSWSGYFKDVFSFFFWDIQFYTGTQLFEYMWLIRMIVVYMPLLALIIAFYYSIPTVSG